MKLTTIEQVQKRVGISPAPRDLKVIDYVDEHALRWLSHCSFAFIALGEGANIRLTAAGGAKGFVSSEGSHLLSIPLDALDNSNLVQSGGSFGALFMVSGMEETLRVNGKVSSVANGKACLEVQECYLHCAKSFKRSDFWMPSAIAESNADVSGFLRQAQFLVLATINASGQADVSPKGDPAGFMIQEHDGYICFADRPGNRRIDSFHNILEQPSVCLLVMVPGVAQVLEVVGTADLCVDEALLDQFEVQGKKPNLITRIKPTSMTMLSSEAISNSVLWPAKERPVDLVPADIFKAHIQRSKESSIQAKIARAAVSLPGAMEKGLQFDYKKNMY
ncbi:MAG: pyridoxamine 5'-phosphate oxidase family protein [Pseudomonadota bacterium]